LRPILSSGPYLEVGEFPMLLRDESALPGGDVRWRPVARTDDPAEAERVMELLNRRCSSEPPSVA
jgi:hypothetical protein